MAQARKTRVVYVTSSDFKHEENAVFVEHCHLDDGRRVGDVFEFDIRRVPEERGEGHTLKSRKRFRWDWNTR